MLKQKEQFIPIMEQRGIDAHCPDVVQILSVSELCELVPQFDGWIIGDDPATAEVFEAGKAGKLKAAVKWGIGVDNVDFESCEKLGIPIINTPGMFGNEVADLAVNYVIGLARESYYIDRQIRKGQWPKNPGISLQGKTVGVVGLGDIGATVCRRLHAFEMNIIGYDPSTSGPDYVTHNNWPESLGELDFLVFTCALNKHNFHMLSEVELNLCKQGIRIVNVARGPLINESALASSLSEGHVHSVALDVFEVEPPSLDSIIVNHELSILGSHNGSNTIDAVHKTNIVAIDKLCHFLGIV